MVRTGAEGFVDLNSIPLEMIESIEVLHDGAATIYESDAIAGVINVITRDAIAGLNVDAVRRASEVDSRTFKQYTDSYGLEQCKGNVAGRWQQLVAPWGTAIPDVETYVESKRYDASSTRLLLD